MESEEYLYHHGVKGMKWGVRKARDKKSFNTKYRATSTYKSGKLATVNGKVVNYNSKNSRKAARAALREGNAYKKAYGSKARTSDQLSVMGNKYTEVMKSLSSKGKDKITSEKTKYWKNVAKGGAIGTGAAILVTLLKKK